MDPAVALVQAYLRLNGYFTETEYPIVTFDGANASTLTDIDILALRFPRAGRWIPSRRKTLAPDPQLQPPSDRMDMIIGEVKERHSRLNRAAYTLPVMETVLRRFGCCENPRANAEALLRGERTCSHAEAVTSACNIRIIVFSGAEPDEPPTRFQAISLRHIARYLSQHLRENADIFLHTSHKDDVLGLMALLTKLGSKL